MATIPDSGRRWAANLPYSFGKTISSISPVRSASVVFYDLGKKTYSNFTPHGVAESGDLLARLTETLGEGSVVLK